MGTGGPFPGGKVRPGRDVGLIYIRKPVLKKPLCRHARRRRILL